uniref:Uncharacterized protein n=1 Tax=Rhizophora mucronata TaxID=61149 RepID=A0A2P2K7I5_RHIMU
MNNFMKKKKKKN